jgi:hypothetical protein
MRTPGEQKWPPEPENLLGRLQARIDELEKELAKQKTAKSLGILLVWRNQIEEETQHEKGEAVHE